MKRLLHLGLTLLCLLALAVLPVLSGATLHAANRGCSESMSTRMPMPPTHSAPPCCAVHPSDGIAAPAAVDISFVLPALTALSLEPFAPTAQSAAPLHRTPSASPPHAFPLPLRI